jgi:anthranilate 1,2-dioxygenase small subunit
MITPELLLRLELAELQDRYIATIDGDRLEDWPALFVEDGRYEIIPRENEEAGLPAPLMLCENAAMMRDRVTSLRQANIYAQPHYRHFLSGLSCRATGAETAAMGCSYVVINTNQDGTSSVYQAGRYDDVVVRTAEGWRFVSKRVVYDTLRVQTLLAYPI